MMAALRIFAMLCAGQLVVLLGGLPDLLRTGQADLRAWIWPTLLLTPAAAILRARRGCLHAFWVGFGSLGTIIFFIWLATGRLVDPATVVRLSFIALLAIGAGLFLISHRWWSLGLGGLAILSCWLAANPVAERAKERPALAVMSALPLFWREGVDGVQAREDAPITKILRQRFDLRPVDSPLSGNMRAAKTLLLAQPRGFSPAELSALDSWVRAGGNMLLLADPLLRWPSPLPLGDRRRAPSVNMLAPLLSHWGVELQPPSSAGEKRMLLDDGRLLVTMASSSLAVRRGSSCRTESQALIARCRIGRGQVVLVADADIMDDRLWLADESAPLSLRAWSADTPGFIIQELGGGHVERRIWIKSLPQLIVALRWAMAAGIFWAIMGTALHAGARIPVRWVSS